MFGFTTALGVAEPDSRAFESSWLLDVCSVLDLRSSFGEAELEATFEVEFDLVLLSNPDDAVVVGVGNMGCSFGGWL